MADEGDIIGVGSTVYCKNCFDEEITGEVIAFERQTKFLVLKRPPTNGRPTQCDVLFLNLNTVKDLKITKEVNSPTELTLQNLDMNLLSARKEAELEKKRRLVAAIKANVSDEGRDLFAHIAKTLEEIQWSGTDIVVMNQVTIKAPYQTANMAGQTDSQAYQYVSKIVEKFNNERSSSAASPSQ
ncbi:protein LSM12 homolog [Pollicipes pollicipes]|uniref:protein LSM12 homolog n=1 Tax=Pollicipes pollicipes TaxID=41117 RepID=UPI00188540E1|nr:protein LSM12 homolog [Pollicipes pollicipes]XP_037076567.1 protein LSM12 homolog [Pollicipes pollicipes]